MATYFVDNATGSDSDDGLSEANAWATIQHAVTTAASGDLIYIKGGTAYLEAVDLNRAVFLYLEGYTATPGDGGRFTIDGQDTRAYCFRLNDTGDLNPAVSMRNFVLTQATGDGFDSSGFTETNGIFLENGHFCENGGHGCQLNFNGSSGLINRPRFINCAFYNNAADGFNGVVAPFFAGCTFRANGQNHIEAATELLAYRCVFDDSEAHSIFLDGNVSSICLACTFNDSASGQDAIRSNGGASNFNILLDCSFNNIGGYCVNWTTTAPTRDTQCVVRNCHFDAATSGFASANADKNIVGNLTGEALFEDEAGGDLTPGAGSPLLAAGMPAGGFVMSGSLTVAQFAAIGAVERAEPAGGGGATYSGGQFNRGFN